MRRAVAESRVSVAGGSRAARQCRGKCLGVLLGLGVSVHPLPGAAELGEQILGLYLLHPLPSAQPRPATHLYCRHRPRWPIAT